MNKNLLLVIAIAFLIDISNQGVPRSTTLLQYPGFTRMLVTFQLPAPAAPHPATLSANILFVTSYTTAPLVIIAAREMSWIGPIAFDFTVDNITTTSCVIHLNKYPITNLGNSELKVLKFCIGLFDDSIYNQTTEIFQYIEPSATVVAQSIRIVNHQLYMYPILTAYEDYIDYTVHAHFNSNPSTPGYTQVLSAGALHNWQVQNTVTNNGLQGYLIKRIRYTMHNVVVDNFVKMTENYIYIENGGVGVFAGIETLASNQFTVPAAHFYGLNATIVFFNVLTQPSINMAIKFITMSKLYKKCPTGYPFYVPDTMLCESACPSAYFQAAQSPSVNNYFICYACDSVCAQCFGVSNNCTSCITGQILSAMDPATNTMTCTCSSNQYNDTFWGCIDCNSSIPYCLSCTDASTCITCQSSLVFNSTTNACECMPNMTPYITTANYVDANGVAYIYNKIRCVSKVVTENCNDAVVTSGVGPAGTGLYPFMYSCACMTGVFINNTCI